MKKTLLLLITFISLRLITYASFPITENSSSKELILNNTQMESGPDMDWTALIFVYLVGT